MSQREARYSTDYSIGEWTREWAHRHHLNTEYFPTVGSTNNVAKEEPLPAYEPKLFVTDHQTHGRGRGERGWEDVPGMLLSSWTFPLPQAAQPIAAPILGLALYAAAKTAWPRLPFGLKAPNDLFLGEKKVAGLLTESVTDGRSHMLIVGLGLNVQNHPAMEIATSLAAGLGRNVSAAEWSLFLDQWWNRMNRDLPKLIETQLTPETSCSLVGALNQVPQSGGKYRDVRPDGTLVSTDGEVAWHKL